jgi:hypothetical protein
MNTPPPAQNPKQIWKFLISDRSTEIIDEFDAFVIKVDLIIND